PRSVLPPPCRQQPPPPFPYTTLFRSPPALLALPLGPSNALSLGPGFVGPEYGFAASAEAGIADESPDHGSFLAPPLRLPPSSDMPLFPALRLDRARAEATRVLALRDSEREVTGTSHGSAHHHPLRPRRQPPSGLVAFDVDPAHLLQPLAVALALQVPAHSHLDGDALVDLGLSAVTTPPPALTREVG